MMVVIGPVLTAAAASSCLLTILSGNVFACANDLPVFIGGGGPLLPRTIPRAKWGIICPPPNHPSPPPSPKKNAHARDRSLAQRIHRHSLWTVPTSAVRRSSSL